MKNTSKKILKSLLSVSAIAAITGLTIVPVIITEPNNVKTIGDPSIAVVDSVFLSTFDPIANTATITFTLTPDVVGAIYMDGTGSGDPYLMYFEGGPVLSESATIGFTMPGIGDPVIETEQEVVVDLSDRSIIGLYDLLDLDALNLGIIIYTSAGNVEAIVAIPRDVIPSAIQAPSNILTRDNGATYDVDFQLFPDGTLTEGWIIGETGIQIWSRSKADNTESELTIISSSESLSPGSAIPSGLVTVSLDGSSIDDTTSYEVYVIADFVVLEESTTGTDLFAPLDPSFGIKTSPSILLEDLIPAVEPSPMTFAFIEATEKSLKYDFTYDNGSLDYNPIITATANGTAVLATDLNVNFDPSTKTGTIELLRLTAETSYEVVFTYDYTYKAAESVDPITASTLEAVPFIAVSTSLDVTNQIFTVVVEGDTTLIDDTTTNTTGTADLILIVDTIPFDIGDATTPDNLVGTHVFNIGATTPTSISLDIVVSEVDTTTPLGLENLIIADGANNDEGITTSYTLNSDPSAEDVIANRATSITPSTGTNTGDLNLEWLVDYPLGITLSELGFKIEISTVDPLDAAFLPTDWVDVSGDTNINPDMKSGIISGLTDTMYSEGVWVQITIDYLDINEDLVPLSSTLSGVPKQVGIPSSGLSTGALIGIIIGSVAGVALIGLGGWFFYKKQNPSSPKDGTDKEPKKTKTPSKKKA